MSRPRAVAQPTRLDRGAPADTGASSDRASSDRASSERATRFEAVFADVYEPLQRYVRRRADVAVVDDIVADVLLVAWRRLDEVPDGEELPWCYGVARRSLANHHRSDVRVRRLVDRISRQRPSRTFDAAAAPAALGLVDEPLARALAGLPELDREVVRLWAWEELAPREIAAVVGATPNAVSIRLHRARRRLAAELQSDSARKDGQRSGHKRTDKPFGARTAPRGSDTATGGDRDG